MKKLLSVLLSVIMLFSLCVTTSADYQPYDIADADKTSLLTISGTTATCYSNIVDRNSNTLSITIEQSLEKQGLFWIWSTYAGEWTKTASGSCSLTSKVSSLESGKYRVKSVFSITMTDGTSETVTVYSAEKSV